MLFDAKHGNANDLVFVAKVGSVCGSGKGAAWNEEVVMEGEPMFLMYA